MSGVALAEEVDQLVLRVLGQAVVAEVPDDGVVVAEHAEVVRHALGVDVPHVGVTPLAAARRRARRRTSGAVTPVGYVGLTPV